MLSLIQSTNTDGYFHDLHLNSHTCLFRSIQYLKDTENIYICKQTIDFVLISHLLFYHCLFKRQG